MQTARQLTLCLSTAWNQTLALLQFITQIIIDLSFIPITSTLWHLSASHIHFVYAMRPLTGQLIHYT